VYANNEDSTCDGLISVWRFNKLLYRRAIDTPSCGAAMSRRFGSGEVIARAMGAGFIYTLATLKVAGMQLALERAGYQLLGIAPGHDRELVAPGIVKPVYEAWYAKVLVPENELLRPDPAKMNPKTKELFQLLFPHFFQPDEPPTGAV
jgi:hypothetical protein